MLKREDMYMRVNSVEQLGGKQVAEKEKSMVEKILDSERVGYAYFYPSDGGNRQEFFISTTPENMANFLGSHFHDAEKMVMPCIREPTPRSSSHLPER